MYNYKMVSQLFSKRLVSFFLVLSLSSYIGLSTSYLSYVFLLVSLIISIPLLKLEQDEIKLDFDDIFLIVVFLSVWSYGVIISMYYHNDILFTLRNFFGMLCVICIIPLKIFSKRQLCNIILIAAVLNSLYALYFFAINGFSRPVSLSTFYNLRSYYSIGLFLLFPIMSVVLAKYVFNEKGSYQKFLIGSVCFFLLFFFSVITTISKGNFLAVFVLLFCVVCIKLVRSLFIKFDSQVFCLILFLTGLTLSILIATDLMSYLGFLYSDKETANSIRAIQSTMITNEFSLLGKGLGATLDSGYIRDENLSYGFELSYHNILHKFGLVSFVLFSCYVYFFVKSLYRALVENSTYSYMSIGCLIYLVPSYGNPMIFSSVSVILTCMCCLLLSSKNNFQSR